MSSRAIIVNFRKYMPFGGEYFDPILTFFLGQMKKYKDEFDTLYLLDSNWNIVKQPEEWIKVIPVDPQLRYFDAYQMAIHLPSVVEDYVLFMDNDMVVYKPMVIDNTFRMCETQEIDVVSIYDTIGEWHFPQLGGKSKFCPYWFAAKKELLKNYTSRDCPWGPNMPEYETLGFLTKKMLEEGIRPFEFEEDKNSIYYDATIEGEKGKDLGYYHIRAGSTPACLLAWKDHQPETYWDYIKNQPKREYLRQCAWYQYMGGNPEKIVIDSGAIFASDEKTMMQFWNYIYYPKFIEYHGL